MSDWCVSSPFIGMEDLHAKDCDEPADQCGDADAHDNAHAATANGGEDLAGDDGGNCGIADHENDVE